jgi:hypothetical protein
MRLTITLDMRRRGLRVQVERALDYPPGHLPGLLAAAVTEALAQPPADVEAPELVPAPRTALDDQASVVGDEHREANEARLRWRVLRALDEGATVEQAAREFGIDPAQIDRWDDDDAAIDARTDLLGAGPGGHLPARVAS